MLTDREIMRDPTIQHLEGEGEWCLNTECHVGEDDE
jgi:hypothetical protein